MMIQIKAEVHNHSGEHETRLTTNGNTHSLSIPAKTNGQGSSANGGELLFLALATCYCNDIYREAAKRNIKVDNVKVEVEGTFGDAPGSAAENIRYNAVVEAEATETEIQDLMRHTDTVAEIHNTLRQGAGVTLGAIQAITKR